MAKINHPEGKSTLRGKTLPNKWTKPTIGGNAKVTSKIASPKIISKKNKVKKVFVLDTNVLIDDPRAIGNFEHNYVVIPITVIDELDNNKKRPGDVGASVRKALKILDESGAGHHLKKLTSGGEIKIEMHPKNITQFDDNDGLIISVALNYRDDKNKYLGEVVFVTNDRAAALKARTLGLKTENYKTNEVDIDVFQKKMQEEKDFSFDRNVVYENGYVTPYIPAYWKAKGVKRNLAQEKAISNLFNPEITFVSLLGQAGTGKTMMAILAGICMVKSGVYKQIVITKPPVVADGNDIGFLPGTKDEKMKNWLDSFIDPVNTFYKSKKQDSDKDTKKVVRRKTEIPENLELTPFDKLLNDGIIKIETGAFVRGSNFSDTLVIVDEAQNISAAVGKTWMTRIGSGSKLVLTGDVTQIDASYLSKNNNALANISVRTDGQVWASTIFLDLGVRSIMSDWAANNL